MNYKLLGVLILTTVTVFMLSFSILGVATMMKDIPSEEKCQSINGYGMQEKTYAEKFFCEYNESGWHFNKTKFREAFKNLESWTT